MTTPSKKPYRGPCEPAITSDPVEIPNEQPVPVEVPIQVPVETPAEVEVSWTTS